MTPTTTFIGIDFAWQSERKPTAIAIARGEGAHASLIDVVSGVVGLNEIVAIVERFATENTVVAIDAPLIIRNTTGRRPCESEISRRFGARHASTHSSNLTLYPDLRRMSLSKSWSMRVSGTASRMSVKDSGMYRSAA